MRPDPRAEYARRLERRRAVAARHEVLDRRASNARLALLIAAASIGWLAWGAGILSAWWLAALLAGFAVLVVVHEGILSEARGRGRGAVFYEKALVRLDHRWAGQGEPGDRFLDEAHPFAADLDLFGRGSLFELLCTARTRAGEETLAAWLLTPAPAGEVRARQAAVDELRACLDLREQLALLGADVRAGVDPEALAAWGLAPPLLLSRATPVAGLALSAVTMAALIGWLAGASGFLLFAAAMAAEGIFAWPLRAGVRHVVESVESAGHDLDLLSQVLALLERQSFTSARLVRLRAALDTDGIPPSRRIARLRRLIEMLDARRNQLFAPLAYLLLWTTQCAHALEAWRATTGAAVPRWLAAVGEMEALCALAGHAYEHPADPFPELIVADGGARLEGEGLGHPLIPDAQCVRNDLRLGGGAGDARVLVVSGSNMSGKSTLLRTVGANTVLALAGAPVRARRLSLTPLAVAATLRIHDSLQAGTSRFYAEITRLRLVVEMTRSTPPPLFLLDEMLNGTNSHDRRIGAEAVVRGLIERGAIGLVTTHDLALSQIAEALAPRAANVHFEDHLDDGRMTFDYVMRPGVMTKSNALALMRAVGLDI